MGVSWENHWPVPSHRQTLLHDVVSSTPNHELGKHIMNIAEIVMMLNRDESSYELKKPAGNPYTVPLNLHFLAVWTNFDTILFSNILLKKEEICWSEENFHLCK